MDEGKRRILVVDDEAEIAEIIRETLEKDYEVGTCTSIGDAIRHCEAQAPELVICDLLFDGEEKTGLDLFAELRQAHPDIDFLMVTGHGSVDSAVRCLRMGVFDYLTKPFNPLELASTVQRVFAYRELQAENTRLRTDLASREGQSALVLGSSPAMRHVMEIIRAVAPMPTSILIRGESGVGKEIIADEIHRHSPRAGGPLVKINCAALPENLLEDELFGHEKGAFTGATAQRPGRFEAADGGTIFLDEIGEMSPLLQAKLLRVLQERTFQRIGSNESVTVDVRVICATNKDLEAAVAKGEFREDLYYRINVVQILVPPLCDRREDIPALAEALLHRLSQRLGLTGRTFSPEALAELQRYEFPGNVRELQNTIERLLIFARSRTIGVDDIRRLIDGASPAPAPGGEERRPLPPPPRPEALASGPPPPAAGGSPFSLMAEKEMSLEEVEREMIRQTLERTEGNMYRAAKILQISRSTLYSKVKKLGL